MNLPDAENFNILNLAFTGKKGKVKLMTEVTVHGLRTDPKTKQQMVWLRSIENNVMLPIVIGHTEAVSIYAELTGEQTPRPLTHDLLRTILDHFDAQIEEVQIVDLRDGIFFAELVVARSGKQMRLDARPSDSIALALKYKAPVYVAEEILKEAGYKVKIELEGTITLERMRRAEDEATEITATDMDMALSIEDLLEEVGEEGISFGEVDSVEGQISELQKMMDLAIREEHYEEASRLRDKIAKLRGEHKD